MRMRTRLAAALVLMGSAASAMSAPTLNPLSDAALESRDADAMNRMGVQYAQGQGVRQDYIAALAWYERAAANGSIAALDNIATLYFYGFGVPQSYEQAARVLELAVDAGDADAQNKLATLYDGGLGVAQDQPKAFELYSRAAEQGYPAAMANLGRMYVEARSVERNDVRGYALIRAALDTGAPASMQAMASHELQTAAARLDEAQLAHARDLSSKLVATFAPHAVARIEK